MSHVVELVKVLGIVGSLRKKFTFKLIKTVLDAIAKKKNVELEIIHLSAYKIEHCSGCVDYCEKTGDCKIKDDMKKLYPKLKKADVLIIGTPTYFWNVSGLVKNFIDRTNPLYYPGALKGKIGAAIAVSEEEGQNQALSAISSFFQVQNIKEVGSLGIAHRGKPIGKVELGMAKALGERVASHLTH